MIDTKEHNFGLLRNHRGEWISDDNAVFLDDNEVVSLQTMAKESGLPFSVEYDGEKNPWVCKREYEDLMCINAQTSASK